MVYEESNPKWIQGHGVEFWSLAQYHDVLWHTMTKKIPICKSKKGDVVIEGILVMKMQPSYDPTKWE